jgi:hypothetical protein
MSDGDFSSFCFVVIGVVFKSNLGPRFALKPLQPP